MRDIVQIGKRYGEWTVIKDMGVNKKQNTTVLCQCSCGEQSILALFSLKRGDSTRCRKCAGSAFIDLAGERFGKWTVLDRGQTSLTWLCRCDCGAVKQVRGNHLRSGDSTGCHKCRNNYILGEKADRRRLMHVWRSMLQRCNNPKSCNYKNYGARGIGVCAEWKSRENFVSWALDHGYQHNLTIDRINNNGNYEPSNCRFRTIKEQTNNMRKNIKMIIGGLERTLSEWADICSLNYGTVHGRYRRGLRGERLIQPIHFKHRNSNAKSY